MKWLLVIFFAGMTLSVALSRHIATLRTVAHETSASSTVAYQSGGDSVSPYLTLPEGGRPPYPAIVVIHEWWGLNDHIKLNARRLAIADDCVVLAVDLYRGKVATTPDLAQELMDDLPKGRAMEDLAAAVAYLKSRKDVDPKRIGVIGWGMGADYALTLAMEQADLKAAVICYGHRIKDEADFGQIGASVLGIFGGKDPEIPVASVRQFEQTLLELDKDVEVMIYPSAESAFMNPKNTAGYREADARDAWSRINHFFAFTLAKK